MADKACYVAPLERVGVNAPLIKGGHVTPGMVAREPGKSAHRTGEEPAPEKADSTRL